MKTRKITIESKALEELIKKTFCYSKNKDKVTDCAYINRKWCPGTCAYAYKVKVEQAKYWNH